MKKFIVSIDQGTTSTRSILFDIYGNQIFDRWQSGHIHYFDWQNLPHATANASLHPRPMLVLTGVMTDRTRELIKVQSNHYLI